MKVKHLHLFFFFVVLHFVQKGQSLANYTSVRNTGVAYSSISSTGSPFNSWRNTTNLTQDDNRSDFTNIGFDFWYNGVRYTQFCVSSNGFIDFSSSTDDGGPQADDFGYDNASFTTNNTANSTNPAIAPFYDDLTAQGGTSALGNSVKYLLSGSAPNRTLTVEWINMAVYQNTTPSLNFQLKLVETTGQILIHYGTMNAGTFTFSYSMGLNGTVLSLVPTAAQLKELQTVNANTFGNAVQNNLSTMPTANSQYIFSPPVPTATAGNLTFSGVSQSGMTLNWTNWASNEVGYVIYNSTDGVNYSFVSQTAVNAVNTAITGLLPGTTYFWRLYAVTEGRLSAAINGTQATLASGNKTSTGTGLWSNAATWNPVGVPTSGDNVSILNGHTVSVDVNAVCNNLTVGSTGAALLRFSGATARTFSVNQNISITNGSTFDVLTTSNVTHSVFVKGNITNNGTLNFATDANSLCNAFFRGSNNQTISGSGATTRFNLMNVNLDGFSVNTLEITSSNFAAASNFLTLTEGVFKLSSVNAVNLTPFTAATSLSQYTGLWINSSNAVVTAGAGITLSGSITVSSGTLNVGDAADEDLQSTGGILSQSGGMINVAGKYYSSTINNLSYFSMSNGTFVVPAFGSTSTTDAPFQIGGTGSTYNVTGGLIVIPREGGTAAQDFGFVNTGATFGTVSGGTLQIGNATSPAAQIISINSTAPVGNLVVNSTNVTAQLSTNSLSVLNQVNLVAGTLNPNAQELSLAGNWNNSGGLLTATSGTVTFNSSLAQSILKSGGETFNAVHFGGTGLKTLSSPLTANASFSIGTGASVDISTSNYSLNLRGNYTNNGNFVSRSGLVNLSGTTAQNIGGSSVTNFYDLTLNNTAGALLTGAENLIGSLTLSNGTFNTNGQGFTMVSTATATARIAQITGTGDITGNVTIQRHVPGGTTGWALLGSPLSSALTLQDWDDDIFISCPTCPDGNAANFLSVYTYNEGATGAYDAPNSYVPLGGITDPITAGKGYWVYMGNGFSNTTDITMDLTGAVRKFAYSIPLNYTNNGSQTDDGWNLICNPYPSAISWNLLRGTTANLDNAVYAYNADLNGGTGGHATFINGISSPAVGSGGIGDNIPMGQAFYVHSTGATAINATEAVKVANNPVFLKSSSSAAAGNALVRFQIASNGSVNDECVLYEQQGAGAGFDPLFDAYKLAGQTPGAPVLALENNAELFQVNGVAPISGTFTMDLKMLTGYSDTFTLSASDFTALPSSACINVYDKFTAQNINLKNGPYVFNFSDTTTVARFVIHISIQQVQLASQVQQPTCANPNGGQVLVQAQGNGPWSYTWKDTNGNLIKTSIGSLSDTLIQLSQGTYSLEVAGANACAFESFTFQIIPVEIPTAAFNSPDSVSLSGATPITFTNNSAQAQQFIWDFGDASGSSTQSSPSYVYQQAGIFQVQLVAISNSGCSDTVYKKVKVIDETTGIEQRVASSNDIKLKSLGGKQFELRAESGTKTYDAIWVQDLQGRVIRTLALHGCREFSYPLSFEEWSEPVYLLRVFSGDGRQTVIKVVVQP